MGIRNKLRVAKGKLLLIILLVTRLVFRFLPVKDRSYLLVSFFVKKTKLFDIEYYQVENPDVEASKVNPIRHYAHFGDKENRQPMPLFSPSFYRSQSKCSLVKVNALLHYFYVGRFQKLSPGPWFDLEYYLKNNVDVLLSGVDPLYHFMHWGGEEGRSPTPEFDSHFYKNQYLLAEVAPINPILHYLNYGVFYGYSPRPTVNDRHPETLTQIDRFSLKKLSSWHGLEPKKEITEAKVDVIVPVYKNLDLTLRCIYSVLCNKNACAFELIVINDCSPEEDVNEFLSQLQTLGLFTYLQNETNCGFVKTVNLGMSLHPSRDVVLLNSDAEVFNNWLDRMSNTAKNKKVASVTPLSNNATICSYPRFLHDNPYPIEIPFKELDKLAASVNSGITVEAPTGVGFCMYLTRRALNKVGNFDYEKFGLGYGEENEWCQRAIRSGFKNLICADVFVRHFGKASFQGAHAERVANAMTILAKSFPTYSLQVERFIEKDPLTQARWNLDFERLRRESKKQNVLIISHKRGGGTERHVIEDTALLESKGFGVYYLSPASSLSDEVFLSHHNCHNTANLGLLSLDRLTELQALLKRLNITVIHTHGLVDYSYRAPMKIHKLVDMLNAKFYIELHDYKVVCPKINLLDHNDRFCDLPDDSECNKCLMLSKNSFNVEDISEWRRIHQKILQRADKVFAPSMDTLNRVKSVYGNVQYEVEPHSDIRTQDIVVKEPLIDQGRPLKVLVIGAISKAKGFDVLLACSKLIKAQNYPIEIGLMGYSFNDALLERNGVHVYGKYHESNSESVISKLEPDVVFLPSIWPETYSYTLSLALKSHLPVFAFNIGAIPERLKEINQSNNVLDLELISSPEKIVDSFLNYRSARLMANSPRKKVS